MMKYMYEILSSPPHIKKTEIVKERGNTVWVKDVADSNDWHPRTKGGSFFDTFAKAKAALIKKALDRCDTLRIQLLLVQGQLDNIKGLKEEKANG